MHSTIHAVCGQQKGQNRAKKPCVTDILKKKKKVFFFLVKRAGRHFGFFKRAGRHEKGAGRRALQNKPRQNTDYGAETYIQPPKEQAGNSSGKDVEKEVWYSTQHMNTENKCPVEDK